ncbi:hypothetical protein B0H17DRAFT_1071358 [Mycena rosella]|uniref:Uncharacterized protein n=1 Tax=Mycena rosella TaxID=1033263 RepID=A0AAD7GE84_MYCRO|nr:hypothetical protein B0H17DRAFT_1071358 [Mycena rosella]
MHSLHTLLLWHGYTVTSIFSGSRRPCSHRATRPRYGSGIWQRFLRSGILQLGVSSNSSFLQFPSHRFPLPQTTGI